MTKPFSRKIRAACRAAVVMLAGCTLASCAAIPHDQPRQSAKGAADLGLTAAAGYPPPTSHPVAATPSAAVSVRADVGAIAPDWWQAMGDPQLDRIMADALAGSPTLAQAQSRLEQAQSAITAARAQQLPQVSADAGTQYQRFSARSIYPAPYGGNWYWMSSAQANFSWSLDIAGRQKALVEAAHAYVRSSAYDAAAARVALSGAVAQAYVNLCRADAQARLADDFARSREASLHLTQERQRAQLASDLDIHAAQTLLAEARSAQVEANGARLLMIHALAALAGRGADYYAGITAPTLRLDTAMPVPEALPADLLG
ncbi:MAG TPA: TolC family protein, partial [Novosphingobium sp.]|nr:TolC family protein [Novosphingobium sp.]